MFESLDHRDPSVAEEIYFVFQRSYPIEAGLIGVSEFPPLKRTATEIGSSRTCFGGFKINGRLAAVVEYTLQDSRLAIDSLVVDPGFFRQGLGEKLMLSVMDSESWDHAEVETATANAPAIRLYEKIGFVATETWMTGTGIEKIRMQYKTAGHGNGDTLGI